MQLKPVYRSLVDSGEDNDQYTAEPDITLKIWHRASRSGGQSRCRKENLQLSNPAANIPTEAIKIYVNLYGLRALSSVPNSLRNTSM